ncbi:CyaY protein [Candidatus Kinetoplastibacterium oncopeltii TCC290E]|uniref:Iron-sulfur cluster assembly protein CyaY n=1 Tax=Candidatus Kinetoplastidibacterium stringomonadis TCC290E TaxID=1208920 RepID=M1M009_9PROT|nr:iron donor protein CyaY [Candidatus Kinetoplastibacterium oncopeltii]AGF48674.1 CyaY protein [Candidatus Kinetoplastibacterium oncopeltii TCC290E]
MKDSDFSILIDKLLEDVEDRINDLFSSEVDTAKSGNVLSIKFDNGCNMVINSQNSIQELWFAVSNIGGFHYKYNNGKWIDNRNGLNFTDLLSKCCTDIIGREVILEF